jgi:N-acetylglucosamine-6-phosphate deacetylase
MTAPQLFTNATLILPDRLERGSLLVESGRIAVVGGGADSGATIIDLGGDYLAPGFIDLHVHGGAGADFMDGTPEAFAAVCAAHLRHGTTSLLPTSTVARHEQIIAFLKACRALICRPSPPQSRGRGDGGEGDSVQSRAGQPPSPPSRLPPKRGERGGRVLGAHFYGPYFAPNARGCHPADALRPPREREFDEYLSYADAIVLATVAPELAGAEEFARACAARGVRLNAGHSHATFDQMAAAVSWGVRHVDHLFCAMSDRARLRQTQTYPMRGGVLEATLFFDELTTEVIADGKHLNPELLKLAYKIKGPDRLALVTDCNRALDMPDGEYVFGPRNGGERILRRDGVGLMPDGQSLASGVMGMDYMVRTFHRLTGVPLPETVRMATLTPARIAGRDHDVGSLEPSKRADLVVLDRELDVRQVYLDGELVP